MAFVLLSTAISVTTSSKKVFDLYKNVNISVSQELVELVMLLDSMKMPFNLCKDLQKNENTIEMVDKSVMFARFAIQKCEKFLDDNEEEDNSWKTKFTKQEIKDQINNTIRMISNCIVSLNLAITSVNFQLNNDCTLKQETIEDKALDIFNEFLMGRIQEKTIIIGEIYNTVQLIGYANVILTEKFFIKFLFEEEEEEELESIKLNNNTKIENNSTIISLEGLKIHFESPGGISCEVVVELLNLCKNAELGILSDSIEKLKIIND